MKIPSTTSFILTLETKLIRITTGLPPGERVTFYICEQDCLTSRSMFDSWQLHGEDSCGKGFLLAKSPLLSHSNKIKYANGRWHKGNLSSRSIMIVGRGESLLFYRTRYETIMADDANLSSDRALSFSYTLNVVDLVGSSLNCLSSQPWMENPLTLASIWSWTARLNQ
jgi:hypothetical protein